MESKTVTPLYSTVLYILYYIQIYCTVQDLQYTARGYTDRHDKMHQQCVLFYGTAVRYPYHCTVSYYNTYYPGYG